MKIYVYYTESSFDYLSSSGVIPRVGELIVDPYNGQTLIVLEVTHKPAAYGGDLEVSIQAEIK